MRSMYPEGSCKDRPSEPQLPLNHEPIGSGPPAVEIGDNSKATGRLFPFIVSEKFFAFIRTL